MLLGLSCNSALTLRGIPYPLSSLSNKENVTFLLPLVLPSSRKRIQFLPGNTFYINSLPC